MKFNTSLTVMVLEGRVGFGVIYLGPEESVPSSTGEFEVIFAKFGVMSQT
jgi:hypothetical protein